MSNPGLLIVRRALKGLAANPFPLLTGLGMSLFFLVVYDAALGGIAVLPAFAGNGYLAYLLPMGIVSLLFGSSSGSAQAISRDIQSGYFRRLALAPVPRSSFVLAAVLADAAGILLGSAFILAAALLLGVEYRNGLAGALGVMALAVLSGTGLSAVSAALVMRTGKPALAGTLGSVVFTLLFLAPTFAPVELMGAAWLRLASRANPLTYIMEAMRWLVSGTGGPGLAAAAFAMTAAAGVGGAFLAARSVKNVLA